MTARTGATLAAHSLDPAPLTERPALAAVAGCAALGVSLRQLRRWLDEGHQPIELRAELDRHGVAADELEGLVAVERPQPEEDAAFALGAELGVRHVLVMPPRDGTRAGVIAGLRRLRERAAEIGACVELEPLPWTVVADPAAAAPLVRLADVGLCLDVWHHFRHGGTLTELASCWPAVTTVQLSDGHARNGIEDQIRDCLDNRLPLGDGAFPLRDVLAGAPSARVSVEVLASRLRAMPPEAAARRIGDSTLALLTEPTVPRSA